MAELPPATHSVVTRDNHSAFVLIILATMMVWMLLCLIMRLVIRLKFNGPFKRDDSVLALASLFSTAQSVAVFLGIKAGLGQKKSRLDDQQYMNVQKAAYTSDILFVVAMCLSKLSSSLLILRFTRVKSHLVTSQITSALSILWGIMGVFTVAIRCDISKPWIVADNVCPDLVPRWIAIETIGIFLEVALVALPIYLVWNVQMPRTSKIVVVLAFSFRTPVIIATALRLHYITLALRAFDFTFASVNSTIITQIELNYSLMAATIPCMKPFMMAFNTGYMSTQLGQTRNNGYLKGNTFMLKSMPTAGDRLDVENRRSHHAVMGPVEAITSAKHDPTAGEEANSAYSHDSDKIMIRQTVGWDVHYDDIDTKQ